MSRSKNKFERKFMIKNIKHALNCEMRLKSKRSISVKKKLKYITIYMNEISLISIFFEQALNEKII